MIKKMWSIHTMDYYSAIRKVEYPTFASTWMGLKEIMLSEISQAEKDNYRMVFTHLWNIRYSREIGGSRKGKMKGGYTGGNEP